MGRPVSKVHSHFQYVKSTSKTKQYKCTHCGKVYSKNTSRMALHLKEECKKCPARVKIGITITKAKQKIKMGVISTSTQNQIRKRRRGGCNRVIESESDTDEDNPSSITESEVQEIENNLELNQLVKYENEQKKLDQFIDKMSEEEKDELWILLARAVYATATPLFFVENEHWRKFFEKIRPAFELPSRYMLSTPLLNNEFDNVTKSVLEQINSSISLSLQIDGWTNVKKDSILNVVITTDSGPVIYKIVLAEENRHTGDYIASIVLDVMEEIGYPKFRCVITDNARNMLAASNIVQKTIIENNISANISFYGCAAHVLNLLIHDVCKIGSISEIGQLCIDIIKKVRNSQIAYAIFKNSSIPTSPTLKLPGKTRWGSLVISLESLLKNKESIRGLAINEEIISALGSDFVKILLELETWEKLNSLFNLLQPIAQRIDQVQGDSDGISKVKSIFNELETHFSTFKPCKSIAKASFFRSQLLNRLKMRKEMAIENIHLAANLLDPRIIGADLTDEEYVLALSFISDLAVMKGICELSVMTQLADYKSKEGLWQLDCMWKSLDKTRTDGSKLSAITWWKGMCGTTKLSKIAIDILQCAPTTAATERSFKTFSSVQTQVRNRLLNTRAGKLTYIKHNLGIENVKKPKKRGSINPKLSDNAQNDEDLDLNDQTNGINNDDDEEECSNIDDLYSDGLMVDEADEEESFIVNYLDVDFDF